MHGFHPCGALVGIARRLRILRALIVFARRHQLNADISSLLFLTTRQYKFDFRIRHCARRHRTTIENTSCSHRLCSPSSAQYGYFEFAFSYNSIYKFDFRIRHCARRHRTTIENTSCSHRLCSPSSAQCGYLKFAFSYNSTI